MIFPTSIVESRLVYTNNPWGSAARGAGPPQAHFALECAMDMLADKLGIDPIRIQENQFSETWGREQVHRPGGGSMAVSRSCAMPCSPHYEASA